MSAPAVPYRADSDGLRGVAVLAVVLDHFGIGPSGGGFVGVEVFFVISGFLITAIVQTDRHPGAFVRAKRPIAPSPVASSSVRSRQTPAGR